jgi:hypothetical protein
VTGIWSATPSVGAVTITKSVAGEASRPGAHPEPLACTTVPGNPAAGDIENDVTAAPATPVEHQATIAPTTANTAMPRLDATRMNRPEAGAKLSDREMVSTERVGAPIIPG